MVSAKVGYSMKNKVVNPKIYFIYQYYIQLQ